MISTTGLNIYDSYHSHAKCFTKSLSLFKQVKHVKYSCFNVQSVPAFSMQTSCISTTLFSFSVSVTLVSKSPTSSLMSTSSRNLLVLNRVLRLFLRSFTSFSCSVIWFWKADDISFLSLKFPTSFSDWFIIGFTLALLFCYTVSWFSPSILCTPFTIMSIRMSLSFEVFYFWCILLRITETSPYSFGNFRKLSLYTCFMPI